MCNRRSPEKTGGGENMKYKVTCYEMTTNEKTVCWWTDKQCELADYLARISVFCLIEPLGYFYRFEDLKKALPEVMKNHYWKEN